MKAKPTKIVPPPRRSLRVRAAEAETAVLTPTSIPPKTARNPGANWHGLWPALLGAPEKETPRPRRAVGGDQRRSAEPPLRGGGRPALPRRVRLQGLLGRLLVGGKRFLGELLDGNDLDAGHLVEGHLELIGIISQERADQPAALPGGSEIADFPGLA